MSKYIVTESIDYNDVPIRAIGDILDSENEHEAHLIEEYYNSVERFSSNWIDAKREPPRGLCFVWLDRKEFDLYAHSADYTRPEFPRIEGRFINKLKANVLYWTPIKEPERIK